MAGPRRRLRGNHGKTRIAPVLACARKHGGKERCAIQPRSFAFPSGFLSAAARACAETSHVARPKANTERRTTRCHSKVQSTTFPQGEFALCKSRWKHFFFLRKGSIGNTIYQVEKKFYRTGLILNSICSILARSLVTRIEYPTV